jgi:hypothetical protein
MTARDMFALVDVTTTEWGAVANYDPAAHGGAREGNDQLFVHHPGTDYGADVDAGIISAERKALRKIEKYAMSSGWWGIAYDIIVGQSGTVYAGRGLARSGATSGDVDKDGTKNNDEGEAVLVLISPNQSMTEACKESLARLLIAHDGTVIGHKNAGGIVTSCPGEERLKFIASYNAGSVATEPAPNPEKNWTNTMIKNLPTRKKRSDVGKTSDWDRKVQGLLAAAGHLDIQSNLDGRKFDGKFGPSTEKAVKAFQKSAKLKADGIVGENTWEGLIA